jgi:hypothetical protein
MNVNCVLRYESCPDQCLYTDTDVLKAQGYIQLAAALAAGKDINDASSSSDDDDAVELEDVLDLGAVQLPALVEQTVDIWFDYTPVMRLPIDATRAFVMQLPPIDNTKEFIYTGLPG